MRPADVRKRALDVLGAGILAVFLLGSASGPLRPCPTHPGHASDAHEGEHPAPSHDATSPTDHPTGGEHPGCSCLGQCSLEHAPGLAGSDELSAERAPAAPKTLPMPPLRPRAQHDPFDLPLARPPPADV